MPKCWKSHFSLHEVRRKTNPTTIEKNFSKFSDKNAICNYDILDEAKHYLQGWNSLILETFKMRQNNIAFSLSYFWSKSKLLIWGYDSTWDWYISIRCYVGEFLAKGGVPKHSKRSFKKAPKVLAWHFSRPGISQDE